MDKRFLSGAPFYEWNDMPLTLILVQTAPVFLNCAFDPPREMPTREPLKSAWEITFDEFECLRAIYRAACREYFGGKRARRSP